MNTRFILSNLKKAEEELRSLIATLEASPECPFGTFHVSMAHAYHHLNSAWNARHITDEDREKSTDANFHRWERFPTDLPLIGDEDFFDHPEYGAPADE